MTRSSQRRGERDRMTSVTHKAGHTKSNPDHDLYHFDHSCALHHHQPRRDEPKSERRNSIDHRDGHLRAFASIDSAKHIEKSQNAGVSSAASCITLEIPMKKSIVTRGACYAGELTFTSDDNRKRRSPVSTKEVEKWRNATGRALYRFKPVFTHQFFTNEEIRGYRPTDGAIEEACLVSLRGMSSNETNQCAHPSFSHHCIAGFTLLIQVRIAPSCRKCCLIVEIGKAAKQLLSNEYQSELATTTNSSLVNRFQSGVVSWDGDDDSCDGSDEDFELKDKFGGRNKRVRSHQPPVRQTRSCTRIGGDSTDDKRKDDCDENFAPKVCRRGRSTQRRKSNPTRRSRRMRHDSESDSAPEQSINSSPRQVTDVSDCPSSDEEDECFHRNRLISSMAYTRSCSIPSSEVTRMKVGTIITQLSAGLPEVAAVLLKDASVANECEGFKILSSNVKSMADIENDYLDQPIGDIVREYSREKTTMSPSVSGVLESAMPRGFTRKSSACDFVLTLADMRSDKDACKYHDEVEKLSQWYIEIASPINIGSHGGTDSDGGFWRVLYLFEKHSQGGSSKYSLAGYMTLFFRSLQMIVCQALCLPPYQRSGHGTEMLRTAYEACGGREIQVESPAPSFASLRNRIDYDLVRTLIEQKQVIPRRFTQPSQLFSNVSTPLPNEVLIKVGSKLNITAHQVEIAFDIWKLHELEMSIRSTINSSESTKIADRTISTMEANYKRVMMQTLLKSLRENVNDLNFDALSRREQSKFLEKCFKTTIVQYRAIIRG